MSERELLEALYRDMQGMKADMQGMKADIRDLKADMQGVKAELQDLKARVTRLEVMLENETNHNLQLLAENHIDLVEKLNKAISVQDKSILYEVQVSGLKMRVEKLEEEIKEIKAQIA